MRTYFSANGTKAVRGEKKRKATGGFRAELYRKAQKLAGGLSEDAEETERAEKEQNGQEARQENRQEERQTGRIGE